jgi:hypothetical protein
MTSKQKTGAKPLRRNTLPMIFVFLTRRIVIRDSFPDFRLFEHWS